MTLITKKDITVPVTVQTRSALPPNLAFQSAVDLSLVFKGWGPFPALRGVSNQTRAWDCADASRNPILSEGSSAAEKITEYTPPACGRGPLNATEEASMARSNPPSNAKALVLTLRLFCLVPFLTGAADLLGGTWILQQAGAAIPRSVSLDPVLNNQIAFWGAIWLGYGVALWWTSGDPLSRAPVARILLGTLFLSGLARGYSLLRYGFPGPVLVGAMAVELGLSPILFLWLNRLAQSKRSVTPPYRQCSSGSRWERRLS